MSESGPMKHSNEAKNITIHSQQREITREVNRLKTSSISVHMTGTLIFNRIRHRWYLIKTIVLLSIPVTQFAETTPIRNQKPEWLIINEKNTSKKELISERNERINVTQLKTFHSNTNITQIDNQIHSGEGSDKNTNDIHYQDVGLSEGYSRAAKYFLGAMNLSVKPCDDFYEFACGGWLSRNEIPDDGTFLNRFVYLGQEMLIEMQSLLESGKQYGSKAITDMRHIYKACMNVDRMNKLRGAPLLKAYEEIGYWPVVFGGIWPSRELELTDLLISISATTNVFWDLYVAPDSKDVSRYILHVDQGDLGLSGNSLPYYLNTAKYAKQMNAYREYMTQTALMVADYAGIAKDRGEIEEEVDAVIEFEKEIAKIVVPPEARRNRERLYNVRNLSDLESLMPLVNWMKFFMTVMPYELYDYVNSNPEIIIKEVQFLMKLARLLTVSFMLNIHNTKSRTIQNYIIWRYTMTWNYQLDERYDNIYQDFLRIFTGQQKKTPRWKICTLTASDYMKHAASALYIRSHFTKSDKEAALEMISDLRATFREMIMESDWMDDIMKSVALDKLKSMISLVGYPDFIEDNQRLDDYYKQIYLDADETFASITQKLAKWSTQKSYRRLIEPVDRNEFDLSAVTVNAYYIFKQNAITFPAAVLQAPLFDRNFPKAVNYGGIGFIIGHEITHGFDDEGSQYDKYGNLHEWWQNATMKRFNERMKCIIDQYSQYSIPETDLKVNGILTQGENVADNGGVKGAYKAYQRYIKKLGREERRLPGLEKYTNDQIFFLSYAQTFCSKARLETLIQMLNNTAHSPDRFRVNGALENQPEFAEAFRCPSNSRMSPTKRCTVW